ncbi:CPBP family intramembrane glutamic endopeptidase [Alkalibacterium thalassium]|uniref:Membrane protease YdiL, CAAX protease family n=1 Tax=Alkalibacterium thalassium TaxID=426701 RepID=A0A1G9FCJ7_9LACT|nr:CPBP family intramembrane glutamic endopeptidase [Alkalibacterium thalassium]SDK86121.1 Membrane protease YdiL, CAAX protease family [Alkalibacterium thalassium]
MKFTTGYPLRKVKISDQILIWLASSFLFSSFTSIILSMIVISKKKIPILNRKRLSKNEYVLIPGLDKSDWRFLAWYIPISFVLLRLGNIVIIYLFGEGQLANQEVIDSMFQDTPLWMMFFTLVIAAPLLEELFFRGVLFFRKEHNEVSWLTLVLTSILFGLIHMPTNIHSAYSYIGAGALFGYAAKRTKAVEAAILYHFLENLLAFIILNIG